MAKQSLVLDSTFRLWNLQPSVVRWDVLPSFGKAAVLDSVTDAPAQRRTSPGLLGEVRCGLFKDVTLLTDAFEFGLQVPISACWSSPARRSAGWTLKRFTH